MKTPRAASIAIVIAWWATCSSSARADTFGGQIHAFRARTVEGDTATAAAGRPDIHPESVTFDAGELAGADFRLDVLLGRLRVGGGIGLFAIRDRSLREERGSVDRRAAAGNGLGSVAEGLLGYELLRGPVYMYVDVRVAFTAYELPVTVHDSSSGVATSWDYHAYAVGAGPRAGVLVPIGHSLMADFALYRSVIGGLEQTTAFVGLAYWENDRDDAFSNVLRRSFGGDF